MAVELLQSVIATLLKRKAQSRRNDADKTSKIDGVVVKSGIFVKMSRVVQYPFARLLFVSTGRYKQSHINSDARA